MIIFFQKFIGEIFICIVILISQDEKSCPYYMKTGFCKFGIACKFNHPQPTTHAAYGSTGSSVATPSRQPLIAGLSAWSLSTIACMSNPRMQGLPYMSLVLPLTQEGTMPVQQGWSTYMVSIYYLILASWNFIRLHKCLMLFLLLQYCPWNSFTWFSDMLGIVVHLDRDLNSLIIV